MKIKDRRIILWVVGGLLGLAIAVALGWSIYDQIKNPGQEPVPMEALTNEPEARRSLLDPKTKATCALCFDTECMDSSICGGSGCVCIKRGMELMGFCASLNAIPPGYEVAP